jgi:hypothetical protein
VGIFKIAQGMVNVVNSLDKGLAGSRPIGGRDVLYLLKCVPPKRKPTVTSSRRHVRLRSDAGGPP